ncbi:glycoside hydrolase family 76 protein [Mucilaginibacter pedocola]|uniref:Beta-galactosidase n=1 Tax=Mucilaginibacter pedocola TaxID=1792845 RepID=A0A1S9P9V0_9SPHI|nr:glycoside hydrolase family 76 protein [Mucilaginibacter pedocola]OOQ57754.1 beta-galactosidase [Mucilaginibacter pedocola]
MKKIIFGLMAVATVLAASCGKEKTVTPGDGGGGGTTNPPVDPPVTTVNYLNLAKETRSFISSNLLTSNFSYRANTTSQSNSCFEWYNVSQIYADAALVAAGDASALPYMNNTFKFMEGFWDKSDLRGGYFASVRLDGTGAGGDKYVDDNGLTGMVYLEAYEITTGADKAAYLAKAKACADWLINSGLWDGTYGGGFWWSTAKPDKPTQSNGVAMQLFAKLYTITGETVYLDWATKTNNWLRNTMYDSASGLYIWKIDGGGAGTKHFEKFTYDNAVMLEAYLLYGKAVNDAAGYLAKAQDIGNAMNTVLWNAQYKGYIFNTDPTQTRVNPAWCGWGTQGMIRLYEQDKDEKWLTFARNNINALNTATRNADSHAYYFFAAFNGSNRSPEIEGVDQAWMQRVQAMMAKYDK